METRNTITENEQKILDFEECLKKSWSKESAYWPDKWTKSNPAIGQCAVTTLIVNDYYGGEILKRKAILPNGQIVTHYINYIKDKIVDLTISQFPIGTTFTNPIENNNLYSSTREYLLSSLDTRKRYEILKENLANFLIM